MKPTQSSGILLSCVLVLYVVKNLMYKTNAKIEKKILSRRKASKKGPFLMLKQFKRWLIGTLALTLIALAALVSPIFSGHAAAPHHLSSNNAIHSQHNGVLPDWFWSF